MKNRSPRIRTALRLVTCVVFAFFLVGGCAGPQKKADTPPDEDTAALLAEAAARFQFPDAPSFMTVLDKAKVTYEKNGGFRLDVHLIWAARAKPSGSFPPSLAVNQDLQTLQDLQVRVWRLDKNARFEESTKLDLKPLPYLPELPPSLAGLTQVEFPDLEADSALEVSYTLLSRPVTAAAAGPDLGLSHGVERSFSFRWQDTRPALRRELILSRPERLDLYGARYRVPSNVRPLDLRSTDRVESSWVLEGRQEGLSVEPFQPPMNDLVGLTAFTPYAEWRCALAPLIADCQKALEDTSGLEAAFTEAVGNTEASRSDRARALVNHFRSKWRYADPGLPVVHQPRRPLKEALDSGWVTPRESALILQAGLRSLGLKPRLFLTRRAPGGTLLTQSPALTQFDQPLLGLDLDGKFQWVDPSEPLAPVGSLPLALLGAQALAVDLPVAWRETPPLLARDHRKERNVKLEISPQGGLTCHVEMTAYGSSEVALRQFLHATTDAQRRGIVSRGLSRRFPSAKLTTYRFNDYRDLSQPLLVEYGFEVPDYSKIDSQGRMVFYPPVFEDVEDFLAALQDKRRAALVLPQNFNSTVRQIYRLPKGWNVKDLPVGGSLANDVAEFITNPKVQFGTLLYERYTGLKKRVISPGPDYRQLLAFYQVVLKQDRTPFIAEKTK